MKNETNLNNCKNCGAPFDNSRKLIDFGRLITEAECRYCGSKFHLEKRDNFLVCDTTTIPTTMIGYFTCSKNF